MQSNIESNADSIELFLITPIYKTLIKPHTVDGVTTKIETQVLVKELRTKKWIRKDAITSVEDYVTTKNLVSKTRCIIYDKYSNRFFATAHNADKLIKILSPITITGIGFKR